MIAILLAALALQVQVGGASTVQADSISLSKARDKGDSASVLRRASLSVRGARRVSGSRFSARLRPRSGSDVLVKRKL